MAHAEICPVCKGAGKLPQENGETSSIPLWRTCHGCGGMGWVLVPDKAGQNLADVKVADEFDRWIVSPVTG